MGNEIQIDLPLRNEKRYGTCFPEKFLKLLSSFTEQKQFSPDEYVHTIYFNNDEHAVPFAYAIKTRRYLPSFIELPVLANDACFLDLKTGIKEQKEKIRLETTLQGAVKIINTKYHFSEIPLRPYIMVEYLRHHYVPKNMDGIRITLDTDLRYLFFPEGEKEGVEIGRESDFSRIEIKEDGGKLNQNFAVLMEETLNKIKAFPVISKKFTAYHFLGFYHVKTSGQPFFKELKNCEIEAKLQTDSEKSIQEAKKIFQRGQSGFKLASNFPYTFESATINKYYRGGDGLFKAMFIKDEAEIVRKGEAEIIEDPMNLNCILKRKEEKGQIVPFDSEIITSAKLQGELYRMRKAFWIDNQRTNRFYHISLDCCLGPSGMLHQMEVEYTGMRGEAKNHFGNINQAIEKEIIEDIAKITKILLEKIPSLKPCQLTKQEWLGIK